MELAFACLFCCHYVASLPVITRHPSNLTVHVDTTAQFECEASTSGSVEIIWKRVDSKLPITAIVTTNVQFDKVTSILDITSTSEYYEGRYFCIVTNGAGNAISNQGHLIVKGIHICICYIYLFAIISFYK